MPNFDLWYPLGISATVYSILTLRLAVRRLARKLRKLLGLKYEEVEPEKPKQFEVAYPIIVERLSGLSIQDPENLA